MIRDVIERFSYRFHLWKREQDEGRYGAGAEPPPVKIYRKSESVLQMVIRYIGVAAMSFIFLSWVWRWLMHFFPRSATALTVGFLIVTTLWLLGLISVFIREYQAKRDLASKQNGSSNQALEPTPDRREKKLRC